MSKSKNHQNNKAAIIVLAVLTVLIIAVIAIGCLMLTHETGIIGGNGYKLVVLQDTDEFYVNNGKAINGQKLNSDAFNKNVEEIKELTEQNVKTVYEKQLAKVEREFQEQIGKTLQNYVQPIGNHVYFFTTQDGQVTINRYDSDTFEFSVLGTIDFGNNTVQDGFNYVVESADYYGVCDTFDNFDERLKEFMNEHTEYNLDNVIYGNYEAFVQISADNSDDSIEIYGYNTDTESFTLITDLNASGVENIYVLK